MNITDYIKHNEKQKIALGYIGKGKIIFYGGARGGGKSYLSLISAILAALQFPGIRVAIIRKHASEIRELFVDRMLSDFPSEEFGYRITFPDRIATATFLNGSKIVMRSAQTEQDLYKILGLEYQFMIIDEANLYNERAILRTIGSLRNPKIKGWKPTLLMTGNPGGVSDVYFKTRFVQPDYSFWTEKELERKEDFVFVQSTAYDNPFLLQNDPRYIENLKMLPDDLRKAWLEGDWNIFSGRFFSSWDERYHVVDDFNIPQHWRRCVGIDLGGSEAHPTVFLWLAQDPETSIIYVYREFVSNSDLTEIVRMVKMLSENEDISMWVGDPSMFGKITSLSYDKSLPYLFSREMRIGIQPAINDRIAGWRILKAWLRVENGQTKLKFFRSCASCLRYLPQLIYSSSGNPEDCNTKMRDDEADALRYAVVTCFGLPPEDKKDETQKGVDKSLFMKYYVTTEPSFKWEYESLTGRYNMFLLETEDEEILEEEIRSVY